MDAKRKSLNLIIVASWSGDYRFLLLGTAFAL
jgi:hypothetical protein